MNNENKASYLSASSNVGSFYSIRKLNFNKLVVANRHRNSLRIKFDSLAEKIRDNADILMISETKLDNSFQDGLNLIEKYNNSDKFNCNCHGGSIMLHVRADIPLKCLSIASLPMEGFYV